MSREGFLRLFRDESREAIARLIARAFEIESGGNPDVGAMYRDAHTIKGGARLVGWDPAVGPATRLEDLLRMTRDGVPGNALDPELLLDQIQEISAAIWPEETSLSPDAVAGEQAIDRASVPATLRVRADRVDTVMGLTREARRIAGSLAPVSPVTGANDQMGRLQDVLLAVEEEAARVRLVPLERLFADLRLAVWNVAREADREAILETMGGGVELDAVIFDMVAESVMQLVRNAIAHGIEASAERSRLGKPARGCIRVAASIVDGETTIAVSDDGAGVDEDAVRASAVQRGLNPTRPLLDLLAEPGLTTRSHRDALAGDGVGLDIVRRRVEDAGGHLSMRTIRGVGTELTIRAPSGARVEHLTVGRIDGVLIGIASARVDRIVPSGADEPGAVEFDEIVGQLAVLTLSTGSLISRCIAVSRCWIDASGEVGLVLSG